MHPPPPRSSKANAADAQLCGRLFLSCITTCLHVFCLTIVDTALEPHEHHKNAVFLGFCPAMIAGVFASWLVRNREVAPVIGDIVNFFVSFAAVGALLLDPKQTVAGRSSWVPFVCHLLAAFRHGSEVFASREGEKSIEIRSVVTAFIAVFSLVFHVMAYSASAASADAVFNHVLRNFMIGIVTTTAAHRVA